MNLGFGKWFKRKRKPARLTIELIGQVNEISDDTYGLVLGGVCDANGKPTEVWKARERGQEVAIGQVEYIKLEVDW